VSSRIGLNGEAFGKVGGELLEAGAQPVLPGIPGEADVTLIGLEQRERELQEAVGWQVHGRDGGENGGILAGEHGASGLREADAAKGGFKPDTLDTGGFFKGAMELAAAGLQGEGDRFKDGMPFG
jgi:hypothetical protein